jgi:hypothetical protein
MYNFKSFKLRLSEGLIKTTNISKSIEIIERNLVNMGSFTVNTNDNKFSIIFYDLKDKYGFDYILTICNNLGWFPSCFKVWMNDRTNVFSWKDLEFLISKIKKSDKVLLYFEAKFDKEISKPSLAYHVFCDLNLSKIKKFGLVPKSLNKITSHPERIYLSKTLEKSLEIGEKLKNINLFNDYNKYKDINYGIVEIDLKNIDCKCFVDPNYPNGFYILNNIPSENLSFLSIKI